jgi:hypothetical protein
MPAEADAVEVQLVVTRQGLRERWHRTFGLLMSYGDELQWQRGE